MRLDRFDLNLLIAFDVLLEERSVTRAAQRLNLTQSAMSAALRRLREAFSDQILVQHGKKMVPTSGALSLAPEVSVALIQMRALVSKGMRFDPATSQRRFRIVASDYITTVLIAPLLRSLREQAPGIQIDISLPRSDIADRLDDGDLDLIISPENFLTNEHPKELLFEEEFVVVGWNQNPVFSQPLTVESFLSCGQVTVSVSKDGTFIDNYIRELGDRRRVEVICAAFSQVPWMLPGTTRLSLMHGRLARAFDTVLPLTVVEAPWELPRMQEMMQYHRARDGDAGLQWLRSHLIKSAQLTQ